MKKDRVMHHECRIGKFFRFDYVSSSPETVYKDPIRVDMTNERKLALIADVQARAEQSETRFAALLAETDKPGGLSDMQIKLDDMETARQKAKAASGKQKFPISAEQKDLQAEIDTEWQCLIGLDRDGSTMKTGEQFFYRQYKAEKIQLSDTGRIYALLVSKTVSKKGEILFTFVRTTAAKAEKAAFQKLTDEEKSKLIVIAA